MKESIESAGEPAARRCSDGSQRSPGSCGPSANTVTPIASARAGRNRPKLVRAPAPPSQTATPVDLVDELRHAADLQVHAAHGLAAGWISGGGVGRCPAEADCSRLADLLSRAAAALQVARQPAAPAPVAVVQPAAPVPHGFGIGPRLLVDPAQGVHQLLFDALCLMRPGMATLHAATESQACVGEAIDEDLLWGAVYLLRQAFAVIDAAASIPQVSGGAA